MDSIFSDLLDKLVKVKEVSAEIVASISELKSKNDTLNSQLNGLFVDLTKAIETSQKVVPVPKKTIPVSMPAVKLDRVRSENVLSSFAQTSQKKGHEVAKPMAVKDVVLPKENAAHKRILNTLPKQSVLMLPKLKIKKEIEDTHSVIDEPQSEMDAILKELAASVSKMKESAKRNADPSILTRHQRMEKEQSGSAVLHVSDQLPSIARTLNAKVEAKVAPKKGGKKNKKKPIKSGRITKRRKTTSNQ